MENQKYSKTAIASLVISVIDFIILFIILGSLSFVDALYNKYLLIPLILMILLAIALIINALVSIKKTPELEGKCLAISAIPLSCINILLFIIISLTIINGF